MLSSCLFRLRGRGLLFILGPAPMEQEVEVEENGGLALVPKPMAVSPVVWASPAFLFRLVLSLALLVFPCPAVAARVSSSLSTTHHVHHFHNKHGTVPIAINRMPFLTRGGHGKITCYYCFFHRLFWNRWLMINQSSLLIWKSMYNFDIEEQLEFKRSMRVDFLRRVSLWWWGALRWVHKPRQSVHLLISVTFGKTERSQAWWPTSLPQLPIGQCLDSCCRIGRYFQKLIPSMLFAAHPQLAVFHYSPFKLSIHCLSTDEIHAMTTHRNCWCMTVVK